MLKLKHKNGGVSVAGQVIAIVLVLAVIGASIYIAVKLVETPPTAREVRSVSISAESPKTAGQSSLITVYAYDAEGGLASGANISLFYSIPSARDEWGVPLQLVDQGDGTYTSSLPSQWAGTYTLTASVDGTDIGASSDAAFVPGEVSRVVITPTSPRPASPWYTSMFTFYFVDQYGNIVPGDLVNPQVESTFGLVGQTSPLQAHPGGTFSVSLDADNWGTSQVTVSDGNSGVSASDEIEFTTTYVALSHDLVEPTVEFTSFEDLEFVSSGDSQSISLDIGIFFPASLGTLGQYAMKVEYDSSILEFVGITDPDPTDNFEAPEVSTTDNVLSLNQTGSTTWVGVSVATLQFNISEWAESMWENLKEKAGKLITWVENLWDSLTQPAEPTPGTVVMDGKVFKKLFIPLKIWIVDGSGVSEDAARSDAERAEEMFNKNAKACRLKYWYVFLVEINHISEDEWNTKAGADGQLTDEERDNLSRQNRYGRWINVYYVPDNALEGALGLWDRSENAIFIDDNADFDNRTLGHELVHELSKSAVKDSPADNASAQGGRDDNNIMNYDNTGDDISEEQGGLIENEVEKRADNRPAGDGGGSIYKPNPYTTTPTLGSVHIGSIETSFEHFEGYSYAYAWVSIEDAEGNPVAGATVTARVDRPDDTTVTEPGTTGTDGIVLLSHYTTFYGTYTFTVTDVQAEGMQYDPAANVVSSASITLA